jgi:hypothetical protein
VVLRRENSEHGENSEDTRISTASGLRRVKSYVQYAVVLGVNREVPLNRAIGHLIWPAG